MLFLVIISASYISIIFVRKLNTRKLIIKEFSLEGGMKPLAVSACSENLNNIFSQKMDVCVEEFQELVQVTLF